MKTYKELVALLEAAGSPLESAMKSHLKKGKFPEKGARGWLDQKGQFWGFTGRHEHDQSAAIINAAHGDHIPLSTTVNANREDANIKHAMKKHGLVRVSSPGDYLLVHSHSLNAAQHRVVRDAALNKGYNTLEHHRNGDSKIVWHDDPTFKQSVNKALGTPK